MQVRLFLVIQIDNVAKGVYVIWEERAFTASVIPQRHSGNVNTCGTWSIFSSSDLESINILSR